MRFYTDIEAHHAVWDGNKMLEFVNKEYETDNLGEIKILIEAGYRHDQEEIEAEAKPKRVSR